LTTDAQSCVWRTCNVRIEASLRFATVRFLGLFDLFRLLHTFDALDGCGTLHRFWSIDTIDTLHCFGSIDTLDTLNPFSTIDPLGALAPVRTA
jgi:hypothetical protein